MGSLRRIPVVLLLGVLVACASPSVAPDVTAGTLEGIAEPSRGPVGTNPLPALEVTEVATGRPLSLTDLLPAERPLLVWFWAPH